MNSTGQAMHDLMSELFPLCRSLTGEGVRKTLRKLQEHIPLTIHEIPTGTACFDWKIPNEWNIRDAYVIDPNGNKVIDFKKSNLHVVSYSIPFEGKLSLEELKPHLHTLPEIPEAIPYITSYYEPRWGFCLSHQDYLKLKEGTYEVRVDSDLKPGSLTYGELLIPGKPGKPRKNEQEILLSTYVCHPSLANNELSGPVVTTFIAKQLLQQKSPEYHYRVLFVPETLGAIAYLSRHVDEMKQRTVAGYVVTCIGDPGPFSYLSTRKGNLLVDRITENVLTHSQKEWKKYSFLERGSDERQYGWPSIDLPVGSLMRSKYGTTSHYHNSTDNLSYCTPEALHSSWEMYLRCLKAIESNAVYAVTTQGEPQLGRRGLYQTLGTAHFPADTALLSNFLAYCDGFNDLITLSEILSVPMERLAHLAELCLKHELIRKTGKTEPPVLKLISNHSRKVS